MYSIDFARLVLEQLHFAAPTASLFNKTALGNMEILELGSVFRFTVSCFFVELK